MTPRNRELRSSLNTLMINGYELAYLERGQGAPLVLVHGSLNDYRAWTLQMQPFSEGYRTIAVSLRHCYPERWNGEEDKFSVRQHADDIAAFVKELKAGPVHVVGHSRGADVALIFAAKHPQLVRSMVLADPAPLNQILPNTPEVIAELENRKAFVTAATERIQHGDLDSGLEIFTDAVGTPGHWKGLPESTKQIRRDNAWSLKSLVADAQIAFSCSDAKKIDAPILLVTGDKSPWLYGLMHAALQPCLIRQQMVTIPNASHGMYTENPGAFNAAVLGFLAANRAQ